MRITMLPTVEALDVNEPQDAEIVIGADGKTIWLNVEGRCVCRVFKIGSLTIRDRRTFAEVMEELFPEPSEDDIKKGPDR